MGNQLLVIALDAADMNLIKYWSDQELLPTFKQILHRGTQLDLTNCSIYRNESPWVSLLTGCLPDQTGYWTPLRFHSGSYSVSDTGAYSFDPFPPFHALVTDLQVTMFDLPHCGRLFPTVTGSQVLGWGAHSPMCNPQSHPAELLGDLQRRYGNHPALRIQNRGTWWDNARLKRLHAALLKGLRRRGTILQTLLKEYPADLSVLCFGELHIAGHHFWHLSDPNHPVFGNNSPSLPNFLLDIYRETDRELGKLLDKIPDSTDLLLFSPEGGAANWCDLNSMLFLPEFLFRWNFPGQSIISTADSRTSNPVTIPRFKDWVETVWNDCFLNLPPSWLPGIFHGAFRKMASIKGMHFPFYVLRRLGPLQWQPTVWYKPWWPQMRAFALPSYGDGYIRFNLKGREPRGIVGPDEIDSLCHELEERLLGLRNPNSGDSLVDKVIRPEKNSDRMSPGCIPDADLVVLWQRQPNDMAEDSTAGRIGPLPFWKSGSHNPTGFVISPDLQVRPEISSGPKKVIDMAPTILDLLGKPLPKYMKGQPLFQRKEP